jgi:hypothetical protein
VVRIVLRVLALGMGLGFLGAVMAAAGGAACAPSYLAASKAGPVPVATEEKPKRPAYFYATKSGHVPPPSNAEAVPQPQQAPQAWIPPGQR